MFNYKFFFYPTKPSATGRMPLFLLHAVMPDIIRAEAVVADIKPGTGCESVG